MVNIPQSLGYAGWRDLTIGDYDYAYLCMPQWPWGKGKKSKLPPFLASEAKLSWVLGILMGLQQALAQATGNIGPPLVLGSLALLPNGKPDTATVQYMLSTAFILAGFFSFLQVMKFTIPGTKIVVGSGLLTVLGASFAFVPPMSNAIKTLQARGESFDEAFGKILGTLMLVGTIQIFFSFLPFKVMDRLFPPMLIGTLVAIVGASLMQAGFYNWGGGVFCGQNSNGIPGSETVYTNCSATDPKTGEAVTECFSKAFIPPCVSGDVALPWSSTEFIALGSVFYLIILFIEFFGSPFMRNIEVMLAMLGGYLVAACVTTGGKHYITSDIFDNAQAFNFLWTKTFKIGFYAPAVLPLSIATIVAVMDNMSAVVATAETAMLPVEGPWIMERIQGALIVDGFSTMFAGFCGTVPSVTYTINGVMALSRCSAREAGYWCAFFYIVFGIVGVFTAFFASIPNFVLGPALTFVVGCLLTAAVQIINLNDMGHRRNKFIVGTTFGFGLGAQMVPGWATKLWILGPDPTNAERTFQETVSNILSSGLCMAALVGVFLHLVIPFDNEEELSGVSMHDHVGKDGVVTHHKEPIKEVDNPEFSVDGKLAAKDATDSGLSTAV